MIVYCHIVLKITCLRLCLGLSLHRQRHNVLGSPSEDQLRAAGWDWANDILNCFSFFMFLKLDLFFFLLFRHNFRSSKTTLATAASSNIMWCQVRYKTAYLWAKYLVQSIQLLNTFDAFAIVVTSLYVKSICNNLSMWKVVWPLQYYPAHPAFQFIQDGSQQKFEKKWRHHHVTWTAEWCSSVGQVEHFAPHLKPNPKP